MTEKATIFQTVQIGIETVAGTPVSANKKLLACSIIPKASIESESFRPIGNKYPSFAVLNKEWSESTIEGKLTYNEILYLLSSLISQPTPVQQGTTSAYKWTFVSNTSTEDTGKTFTVEQGDGNTAWRAAGVRVSGISFTLNRNECSISGTAIGEPIETDITMTSNPSSLTPKLVLPAHLKLYMADSQSGLNSASPASRGFSLTWELTNKIGLAFPIGQDPVTVEIEPTLQATLRVATDTTGLSLWSNLRGGTTKWFRIKAEGDTIEETYKYTFQIDFPAQVLNVGEFSDNEGIYVIDYTLQGIHDATWNKAFSIDVITNVQAL